MSTHGSHRNLTVSTGWGVGSLLRGALRRHERRRAAATLAKLDDRLLRDIGLTRADAEDAAYGRICPQG